MGRSDERHGFAAGLKRVRAGGMVFVIAATTGLLGGCHNYGGASVPIEGDDDWRAQRPAFEGATPVADEKGKSVPIDTDMDKRPRR